MHLHSDGVTVTLFSSGVVSSASRTDEGTAELKLLFDPGLLKQHVTDGKKATYQFIKPA